VPAPTCSRRPVVALIATGDELVMPGEDPGPDQIVASNLFALKAMAEAEGARVRLLPIARDTEAALTEVLDLARGADVIVTIGGASVGDHDLVARVAGAMGLDRAFYKIAMRPGKPLMAGRLGDAVMLGLPGNPVSAIVCGHLFLLPLLRALQGLPDPAPTILRARLAREMGLVKLGTIAVDGTKIKANASKHKAMSYLRMGKRAAELEAEVAKWLSSAEATDAAEDQRHGPNKSGDEMPKWVADKKQRGQKIRAAKA